MIAAGRSAEPHDCGSPEAWRWSCFRQRSFPFFLGMGSVVSFSDIIWIRSSIEPFDQARLVCMKTYAIIAFGQPGPPSFPPDGFDNYSVYWMDAYPKYGYFAL